MGASEQKDAPLETILGASEQKDASLETILGASDRQPLPLDIPTRVPERQPLPLENILGANGCHRPIKWFPTEANERRAHVSENISGANERHRPIKWFSTEANGRRPPPLDLSPAGPFEGAYAIRPYPTGGWDAVARKMVSDRGEWASGARIGKHSGGG